MDIKETTGAETAAQENSRMSPQGYKYGIRPKSNNPFWEVDPLDFNYTAEATVDDTTGAPAVTTETTRPAADTVNTAFHFSGLKGEKGDTGAQGPQGKTGATGATGAAGERGPAGADGITPDIMATATIDNTTGTPAVSVTDSGTKEAPVFDFTFTGLKGEKGDTGARGPQGEPGTGGGVTVTRVVSPRQDMSSGNETGLNYQMNIPESCKIAFLHFNFEIIPNDITGGASYAVKVKLRPEQEYTDDYLLNIAPIKYDYANPAFHKDILWTPGSALYQDCTEEIAHSFNCLYANLNTTSSSNKELISLPSQNFNFFGPSGASYLTLIISESGLITSGPMRLSTRPVGLAVSGVSSSNRLYYFSDTRVSLSWDFTAQLYITQTFIS